MDLINENIRYVAESENEIVQIPSPWLTMTLQARLAWGASTNCLRPELNKIDHFIKIAPHKISNDVNRNPREAQRKNHVVCLIC